MPLFICRRASSARYIALPRSFAPSHPCPPHVRDKSYLIIRTFGHSVGTSVPELQRLTEELGIAPRVRWVGSMAYEEQPGLFAAADLAVNFPEMDAFPVTILECLACGVPVITNRLKAYESHGVAPYLTFTAEDSMPQLGAAMAQRVCESASFTKPCRRGPRARSTTFR